MYTVRLLLLLVLAAAACERKDLTSRKPVVGPGSGSAAAQPEMLMEDIDSKDILARTTKVDEVWVEHILIGWKELGEVYRGEMDPRAQARSNAEAATLAKGIAERLRADPTQLQPLIKEHSEDPGSQMGEPMNVTTSAKLLPELKDLALRLDPGEVGIVKTAFGYHVMMRVGPPKPDPLESADVLARQPRPEVARVQHVLIAWKDVPAAKQRPVDPRAAARTRADADKIAQEVLAKLEGGADMGKLMKEYSEDPGSKDTAKVYDIEPSTPFVESFKRLSMRLQDGEAGMVLSPFGWHVIKRLPPPPPDALESADILARKPVTKASKVKHILLGYQDLNGGGDPRGAKRTRAEVEALVKKTVASLKKGAKIEPLMKELSEDPGSAESGTSYDVTPDAGLVEPFKALGLRLNVDEVGVVKTDFGFHIIQRTE